MSSAYAKGWGSHRVACLLTSTTRVDFEHFVKARSRSLTPRLREDVRVEEADDVLEDELCHRMPDLCTHLVDVLLRDGHHALNLPLRRPETW